MTVTPTMTCDGCGTAILRGWLAASSKDPNRVLHFCDRCLVKAFRLGSAGDEEPPG